MENISTIRFIRCLNDRVFSPDFTENLSAATTEREFKGFASYSSIQMPVTTRLSQLTVAEKDAIKALVELKKTIAFAPAQQQQRPRRACTIKEEPVAAPRSPMDRPRRSNVHY